MSDQERKEFEAWAEGKGADLDRYLDNGQTYVYDEVQAAWEGWQARDSEIEVLRTELQLTKETHLAVVRRLQKELDETKKALELSRKYELSAQYQSNEAYYAEQRHAEQMHIQCGGNDGPY